MTKEPRFADPVGDYTWKTSCDKFILTNAKVKEITADSVIYEDLDGKISSIPTVSVISAFGYKAYNPLEATARKAAAYFRRICSQRHESSFCEHRIL